MRVEFEAGRLVFSPENETDGRMLSEWWAQLQTCEQPAPPILSARAEKALILILPQY